MIRFGGDLASNAMLNASDYDVNLPEGMPARGSWSGAALNLRVVNRTGAPTGVRFSFGAKPFGVFDSYAPFGLFAFTTTPGTVVSLWIPAYNNSVITIPAYYPLAQDADQWMIRLSRTGTGTLTVRLQFYLVAQDSAVILSRRGLDP